MTLTGLHELRAAGRRLAAEHLERLGYRLCATGRRTRLGELDLIAYDETTIVFAQVRTHRAGATNAQATAPAPDGRCVRGMAAAWLAETTERPRGRELRFDRIDVTLDRGGRLVALHHSERAL